MIIDNFWAKKEETSSGFKWLNLTQHLEDTGMVALFLFNQYLSNSQRNLIAESIGGSVEDAQRIVKLLANLHDIGKATPSFQIKRGFNNSEDLDYQLIEKLERIGFNDLRFLNLPNSNKTHHSLASDSLLSWYGFKKDFTSIIGAHHGRANDEIKELEIQKTSYASNYFQTDLLDDLTSNKWNLAQIEAIEYFLSQNEYNDISELPNINEKGQVILSGLVIMADWISSNPIYFPLVDINDETRLDTNNRAIFGANKWLKTKTWEPTSMVSDSRFNQIFRFSLNDIQSKLLKLIKKADNPGIIILEAPMGIGKTEAALAGAESLAYKKGLSGLFFGLPTQATSNGIFPRIYDWLRKIDNNGENTGIRLMHGKAHLNENFTSIANNINIDGEENGSVIVNEWFSGRKSAILDDFIVGTVDQFLLVALKQKHLFLRHLGFSKKVVVIDEVHAYDAYMSMYLYEALTWMGYYDIPIIILSATLPASKREDLIKSYLKGKGIKNRNIIYPEGGIKGDDYPLITYTDKDKVFQEKEFILDKPNKDIEIKFIKESDLENLIDNLYSKKGVIGVILNTVKRSQDLARVCIEKYGEENIELLHSNLIDRDRVSRENKIIEEIGKDAIRPDKKIIIGTQVIEQSLDIDFDVLITDLAPMDLILQRIGRLHRHDIKRPEGFKTPTTYILGVSNEFEFNEGSSFIYGDYLLARTQYFLKDKITIPKDISTLVQLVYSDLDLTLNENLEDKYIEFKKEHEDKIIKKENKAKDFRLLDPGIRNPRRKEITMHGWLKNPTTSKSEEKSYAQVRDIEETIEVIALKKVADGYGLFNLDRDISSEFLDNKIAKMILNESIKLPQSLSKSYNIDNTINYLEKYNTINLSSWCQSPWLRGALGIIFDENNQFNLNGTILIYDKKLGLIKGGNSNGQV